MRPNLLLVLADQWPAAAVGAYGCPVPGITPHLDALAARGAVFERHHPPIPVCGPSRVSLMTGCSPSVTGAVANDAPRRPDLPFLTQDLREAGYRTAGAGKFHFTPHTEYPPADLDHLGFDRVEVTEDTKHGPWLDWVREQHPEHYEAALATAWPMPYLAALPPDGRDARAEWAAARDRHLAPLQAPPHRRIVHPSPLPEHLHQSAWIADRAIEQLTATDDDAAFFQYVSFVDPHDPYDPPEPWASLVDPEDVPPPLPQEWTRDDAPWQYPAFQDTKFELDTFDDGTWARLRAAFFGSCAFVDHQVGRVLAALEATGRAQDTLVLFTTDHGDLLGDHGLLMKGPWHYDGCIRVPMIAAGPGVRAGLRFDGLTSHLDLRPTLLGAAGVDAGPGEGIPLPLAGEPGPRRPDLLVETNTSYVGPELDLARTLLSDDGWRLTIFPGQRYGELFDLHADPGEQRNVFHHPEHRERRLAMTADLVGAMARPAMAGYRPGRRAHSAPAAAVTP